MYPALQDAGLADWICWGLQSGHYNLDVKIVAKSTLSSLPSPKAAQLFKIMCTPAAVTQQDVLSLLFEGDSRVLSNPTYSGMTIRQARQLVLDGPADSSESEEDIDEVPDVTATDTHLVRIEDIFGWQLQCAALFEQPETKFGRKIYWFWEPSGNVGKSNMCAYFADSCGALQVSSKSSDAYYAINSYVNSHGHGPPLIVMDIPRTHEDVNYESIEKIKDGHFFSSKYMSAACRYARPHVACFANELPNLSALSLDRFMIFAIVTDGTTHRLQAHAQSNSSDGPLCSP